MAVQPMPRQQRGTLASALVITRREVRDSLRDWRILVPTIILTLVFPFQNHIDQRITAAWLLQRLQFIEHLFQLAGEQHSSEPWFGPICCGSQVQ